MNPVFAIIHSLKLPPNEAMNRLQEGGIISDNCIAISDIPESDLDKAAKFLFEYEEKPAQEAPKPVRKRRFDIFKF